MTMQNTLDTALKGEAQKALEATWESGSFYGHSEAVVGEYLSDLWCIHAFLCSQGKHEGWTPERIQELKDTNKRRHQAAAYLRLCQG